MATTATMAATVMERRQTTATRVTIRRQNNGNNGDGTPPNNGNTSDGTSPNNDNTGNGSSSGNGSTIASFAGPGPILVGGSSNGQARVYRPQGEGLVAAQSMTFFSSGDQKRSHGTVVTSTVMESWTLSAVRDRVGFRCSSIIDGATGQRLTSFQVFESQFTGGVYVTTADLNGDGMDEVIVTPDQGGGPVVAIYDGARLSAGLGGTSAEVKRFFGIEDPDFRGGARAALSDVNGDGTADLIVSAGFLGGPRIALFDGNSLMANNSPQKLVADFFAFEDTLRNGAFVAGGDINADGHAELVFGGGPWGWSTGANLRW